jgi:hypothetical protein
MADRASEHPRPTQGKSDDRLTRWEVGSAPVEAMVHQPGREAGFQLVMWVESGSRHVLAARFVRQGEIRSAAAELLDEATQSPRQGHPRRPGRIIVRDEALLVPLQARAERLGIEVSLADELPDWDRVIGEFGAFLAAHWPGRSYVAGRGVTPASIGYLFDAAGAFYTAAPWRELPEIPLELRLAERSRPFYLVVLGHDHEVQGLALHMTRRSAARATGPGAHPGFAGDAIAMTFEREDSVPPRMRDERRAHRWPLAGPAAFPLPYRRLPSGAMREPSALELTYLTLGLQAVTELVTRDGGSGGLESRVETVQLHSGLGDSIARLVIPAPFVSSAEEEPGLGPRAG